jgi:pSer/pThr/pTyr-binding forkhead associated (FHA) protein
MAGHRAGWAEQRRLRDGSKRMQAVLVMFRADGERRSFSIARDMTVIGRREDCDLRIPLGDVSRKHCRIVRDGDMLKLEDLGSSNGTFLNAHRVQEALLSPGDSIQVGPVVFVLQVDGEPDDDELSPVMMNVAAATGGGDLDDIDELLTTEDEAGSGVEATAMDEAELLEEVTDDNPTAAGGDEGEIEELEPVEELEPAEELESVEELDPLEPDLGDETIEEAEKKHR